MKTCSSCQRHLPRVAFYRHSKTKDGLQTACKECQRARARRPHMARWKNIKARLFNSEHPEFHNYGGRGITMHPEWAESYAAFAEWLDANFGPCPPGHSLDRIENDRGYEPGNLRWASALEQTANRRPRVAEMELPKAA